MKFTSATLALSLSSTAFAIPAALQARDEHGFYFSVHRYARIVEDSKTKSLGGNFYRNFANRITGFPMTVPEYSGIANRLYYKWDKNPAVMYSVRISNPTAIMMNHEFHIHAPSDGTYTITIQGAQDDLTLVYVGQKAYTSFTLDNKDLFQPYHAEGGPIIYSNKSFSFKLKKGDCYPVRILGTNNYPIQGIFSVKVTGPDGSTLISNSASATSDITHVCKSRNRTYRFPSFPFEHGKAWPEDEGSVEGTRGKNGKNGKDGKDGKDGKNGKNGKDADSGDSTETDDSNETEPEPSNNRGKNAPY